MSDGILAELTSSIAAGIGANPDVVGLKCDIQKQADAKQSSLKPWPDLAPSIAW